MLTVGCIQSHLSSEPPPWEDWGGTARAASPLTVISGLSVTHDKLKVTLVVPLVPTGMGTQGT